VIRRVRRVDWGAASIYSTCEVGVSSELRQTTEPGRSSYCRACLGGALAAAKPPSPPRGRIRPRRRHRRSGPPPAGRPSVPSLREHATRRAAPQGRAAPVVRRPSPGTAATVDQRRELLVAAGWLALLGACTHFDLHDHVTAEANRIAAFQLGQQTGHHELMARSLETKAWFALTTGDARSALDLVNQGKRLATPGTGASVQLAVQEARARARLGDCAEVRRAIERPQPNPGHVPQAPPTTRCAPEVRPGWNPFDAAGTSQYASAHVRQPAAIPSRGHRGRCR
jgi:hypothetical protein